MKIKKTKEKCSKTCHYPSSRNQNISWIGKRVKINRFFVVVKNTKIYLGLEKESKLIGVFLFVKNKKIKREIQNNCGNQ